LEDPVVTSGIETALAFIRGRERVEIEIGSGNGHFLAAYGARMTDCTLLGIEAKIKRCEKIEKKVSAGRLDHIGVFRGRAEALCERLEPGSVDAFHVYFPDPWPKTKHRRRRLLRLPTFELLHRVLKNRGRIFFGSDVFDYYLQVKVLALVHGGFTVTEEPVPPEAVHSLFSLLTGRAGKKLHALVVQKNDWPIYGPPANAEHVVGPPVTGCL
jgi:tRNA (guanine-N7-)-methyltransferase